MADQNLGAYNIFDLRSMALKRVPKGLFEFVDRGTEDEVALRNNRAAFERIKLRPRTLVDVSGRNQEITLFGNRQKMPIAIAIFREEIDRVMALIGCRNISELGPEYLYLTEPASRAVGRKPGLKLLDATRTVAEG